MNRERIAVIHETWFGELDEAGRAAPQKIQAWFQKSATFDAFLKEEFEQDVRNAIIGKYASWLDIAEGRLACIILIDQFCRNIYRNTANAFAHDHLARAWTIDGLKLGHDQALPLIKRSFFYLPLEHAEDKELQTLSVDCYRKCADEATAGLKEMMGMYWQYAVKHQEIIERFNRFPHRNEILGRISTKEEIAFLKEPGSSF